MSLNPKPEPGNKTVSIFNYDSLKKAAPIIRAMNNPLRKRIIELLMSNDTLNVTNMVHHLREEQTVISQHLNILRKAKIVTFLKKGKNVYYFLDKSRVDYIQKCLAKLFDETL